VQDSSRSDFHHHERVDRTKGRRRRVQDDKNDLGQQNG
jgi:hypothetical protein